MYKLDVDLEKQITELSNACFISPSNFLDPTQDIRNEKQAEVLEYYVTDDEMSEYWN